MTTNVKINLGLDVLRKREDGFHELETLFVPYYGFGDELEISRSQEFGVRIDGGDWDPQKDLCVKAYRLLQQEFDLPPVSIRLVKGAPVGAGLGGGSADAAAALQMLNQLFSLSLSDEQLASRAAMLGSDCAFFIYNRPMIGTGRGDILEPFPLDLKDYEIRVEMPAGESVSTAEAYRGVLDAKRQAIRQGLLPDKPLPLRQALARPIREWRELVFNDFEATIFPLHPAIAELKASMYAQGAVYASMSGSGASVFGIFAK